MAESDTAIANRALLLIGQARITSLQEDSKSASVINEVYAQIRDEVLRSRPWNFATSRASLALLAEAPDWGFSSAFQLPNDFLRLIWPRDDYAQFRIEGDQFLSDSDSALIRYIRQVTDTSLFDPLFTAAFAAKLAAETALALTGETQKWQAMTSVYLEHLQEAALLDSIEAPVTSMAGGLWSDARFRGSMTNLQTRPIVRVEP